MGTPKEEKIIAKFDVYLDSGKWKIFLLMWIKEVTKDAAAAGIEITRKAMEVSTKNDTGRKVSSVDEEVSRGNHRRWR